MPDMPGMSGMFFSLHASYERHFLVSRTGWYTHAGVKPALSILKRTFRSAHNGENRHVPLSSFFLRTSTSLDKTCRLEMNWLTDSD